MRKMYELVSHDDRLPVRVFLHHVLRSPRHWHRDVELLLVLEGEIAVVLDAQRIVLGPSQLCIVNSCQVHHVEGLADNLTLAVQLDPGFLDDRSPGFRALRFLPSPEGPGATRVAEGLKRAIAELMRAVSRRGAGYLFQAHGWIFTIAHLLETGCVDPSAPVQLAEPAEGRLKKIAEHIDDNTHREIDLESIAAFAGLSPQYLSRYFSSHMGVTITKYIASIRARNSLEMLENGRESVTDIAFECGFPNLKAYYAAFRENYGMTPGEYREKAAGTGAGARGSADARGSGNMRDPFDYLAISPDAGFAALSAFLEGASGGGAGGTGAGGGPAGASVHGEAQGEERIVLDAGRAKEPFARDALQLAAFGRAAEWRHPEWRRQFSLLRRECGIGHVRFHGILDDALGMVRRKQDGSLGFDFSEAEGLFDFLLGEGVKPFLELGFMPEALASGSKRLFEWKANVSPPRVLSEWMEMVTEFLGRLADRYGRSELRSWHFEIWNEPDMEGIFWSGSRQEFFDFFQATWEAIKSFDPELRAGGCGCTHWNLLHGSWFGEFSAFCREKGIRPDFMSFHVYPLEVEYPDGESNLAAMLSEDASGELHLRGAGDRAGTVAGAGTGTGEGRVRRGGPDAVRRAMRDVEAMAAAQGFAGLPLFVTEWNSSPVFGDAAHDTAFMGPFAARELVAGAGLSQGRAWWVFSDIFEERRHEEREFHGGFGLMTRSGVKKPSWHAHCFHARLAGREGTLLLGRGESWAASLDPRGTLRVLLWNYCHYREEAGSSGGSGAAGGAGAGGSGAVFFAAGGDPYGLFEPGRERRFRLVLSGAAGGSGAGREARIWRVGRKEGSAFDAWVAMGKPDVASDPALIEALRRASEPSLKVVDAGAEGLALSLAPHDLVLVEFAPPAR